MKAGFRRVAPGAYFWTVAGTTSRRPRFRFDLAALVEDFLRAWFGGAR